MTFVQPFWNIKLTQGQKEKNNNDDVDDDDDDNLYLVTYVTPSDFIHIFPGAFWCVCVYVFVACDCDLGGSTDMQCEDRSGQCICRPNVEGRQCDRCEENKYNITAGCISKYCTNAGWTSW